jgi:hypothetical protein
VKRISCISPSADGRVQDLKKRLIYYVSHARGRSMYKFIINANNGCLGDFDRGRTQTAAILVGEVPSTFDPAVSEWSNPSLLGEPCVKLVP